MGAIQSSINNLVGTAIGATVASAARKSVELNRQAQLTAEESNLSGKTRELDENTTKYAAEAYMRDPMGTGATTAMVAEQAKKENKPELVQNFRNKLAEDTLNDIEREKHATAAQKLNEFGQYKAAHTEGITDKDGIGIGEKLNLKGGQFKKYRRLETDAKTAREELEEVRNAIETRKQLKFDIEASKQRIAGLQAKKKENK